HATLTTPPTRRSSDLGPAGKSGFAVWASRPALQPAPPPDGCAPRPAAAPKARSVGRCAPHPGTWSGLERSDRTRSRRDRVRSDRSEEHTSELQSRVDL